MLMDANRWIVAGVLLAIFFGAMAVAGLLDPIPLSQSVTASDPNEKLFQALVAAIITGVTLVVSLNQLGLSQELGPAREHFKTLYFQWELVNLSRAMLYTSIPALLVSTGMIIYCGPGTVTGSFMGIGADTLATSFAVTVALVPFILLLSYILRIATVAKRTLSIGP
ncbi:MAG: hypothetical protein ABEJ66_01395, partial [Candidatus Nanohaloarchaea archaeon]